MKTNKIKLMSVKVYAILFILLLTFLWSIMVVINPEKFIYILLPNKFVATLIGALGILFIPVVFYYLVKMAFHSKAYFLVDETGIHNGVSPFSKKSIVWESITEIRVFKKQKKIGVYVKNDKVYYDSLNPVIKMLIALNFKKFGTPLILDSIYLNCSFDEFENLIIEKYDNFLNTQVHEKKK